MTNPEPPLADWRDRTSYLYASGAVRAGLPCTSCGTTYRRCTEHILNGRHPCCVQCWDGGDRHDERTIAPAHDSVESFPADTADAVARLRACIVELTRIVEDWPR